MDVFEFNETDAAQNEKLEILKNLGPNTNTFINRNDLDANNAELMEYLIHNNGGRPYKVAASRGMILVFDGETNNYKGEPLIAITKFIGFWPGMDTSMDSNCHGNSVLIQVSKKSYISVGCVITKFETDEKILDYISPVGNSDVPYPVAYSDNHVYFMLDHEYIKTDELITVALPINAENMYGEFYGHIHPENKEKLKKIKMKNLKKFIKKRFR